MKYEVDWEERIITVHEPMVAEQLHREVQDMLDQTDYMIYPEMLSLTSDPHNFSFWKLTLLNGCTIVNRHLLDLRAIPGNTRAVPHYTKCKVTYLTENDARSIILHQRVDKPSVEEMTPEQLEKHLEFLDRREHRIKEAEKRSNPLYLG